MPRHMKREGELLRELGFTLGDAGFAGGFSEEGKKRQYFNPVGLELTILKDSSEKIWHARKIVDAGELHRYGYEPFLPEGA